MKEIIGSAISKIIPGMSKTIPIKMYFVSFLSNLNHQISFPVPLTVLQVSQSPFFDVLSGILRMYVKLENRELYNTIPSFWINGDQGAKWNSGFFQIEKTENPFQVKFYPKKLDNNIQKISN